MSTLARLALADSSRWASYVYGVATIPGQGDIGITRQEYDELVKAIESLRTIEVKE